MLHCHPSNMKEHSGDPTGKVNVVNTVLVRKLDLT